VTGAAVPSATGLTLSRQTFHRLAGFIHGELGIAMKPEKITMLETRLRRRLRVLGATSFDVYCERLLSAPAGDPERIAFFDAVTTNKTDFFREPAHFGYLLGSALPALCSPTGSGLGRPLRVWCAGCSSGEEPYTLAMVLSDFADRTPGFDFSIRATDISTRVLDAARLGVYRCDRIDPVSEPMRKRFLLRGRGAQEGMVRVAPAVRAKIVFQRLNLMDADYRLGEPFDIVFFRNVMIYFDQPTKQAVIRRIRERIRPGGFLFIGHSESLAGLQVGLHPVATSVFRIGARDGAETAA
jgi:chemotaxis protein methyltransferase CheR